MALLDSVDLPSLASQVMGGGILIVALLFFIIFNVGWLWIFFKWKKYNQYQVYIKVRDAQGNVEMVRDRAGIFKDVTGKTRFWLSKAKVGIDPSKIYWYRNGGKRCVDLIKVGEKCYKCLRTVITDEMIETTVSVEDTNWAKDEYQVSKKAFWTDLFEKYAGIISTVLCAMVILIMVIFVLQKFDALVELGKILQATSANLKCGGTLI